MHISRLPRQTPHWSTPQQGTFWISVVAMLTVIACTVGIILAVKAFDPDISAARVPEFYGP